MLPHTPPYTHDLAHHPGDNTLRSVPKTTWSTPGGTPSTEKIGDQSPPPVRVSRGFCFPPTLPRPGVGGGQGTSRVALPSPEALPVLPP